MAVKGENSEKYRKGRKILATLMLALGVSRKKVSETYKKETREATYGEGKASMKKEGKYYQENTGSLYVGKKKNCEINRQKRRKGKY